MTTNLLWLAVMTLGPILIALAIIYAVMRRRSLTVAEEQAGEAKAHELFNEPDDEKIVRPRSTEPR